MIEWIIQVVRKSLIVPREEDDWDHAEGGGGEMQWEDVNTWQLHAQEASVSIVLIEQQTTAIAALVLFLSPSLPSHWLRSHYWAANNVHIEVAAQDEDAGWFMFRFLLTHKCSHVSVLVTLLYNNRQDASFLFLSFLQPFLFSCQFFINGFYSMKPNVLLHVWMFCPRHISLKRLATESYHIISYRNFKETVESIPIFFTSRP